MDNILFVADSIYGVILLVAGVLAALQSSPDLALAKKLILIGAIIMAVRWAAWGVITDASWPVRAAVRALLGATLLTLVPAVINWINDHVKSPTTVTQAVPPPAEAPKTDVTNLRPLSDEALRTEVKDLTATLRQFEATYEKEQTATMGVPRHSVVDKEKAAADWDAMVQKSEELSRQRNYEWQIQYRGRTKAVYEELCRRLGVLQAYGVMSLPGTRDLALVRNALELGMLMGNSPVGALADYLEALVRKLK